MNDEASGLGVSRRDFLKTTTAVSLGAALNAAALVEGATEPGGNTGQKMIGIQAGAVSFVDEGVERVLDIFQEQGAVNTIFLAAFTYEIGRAHV